MYKLFPLLFSKKRPHDIIGINEFFEKVKNMGLGHFTDQSSRTSVTTGSGKTGSGKTGSGKTGSGNFRISGKKSESLSSDARWYIGP